MLSLRWRQALLGVGMVLFVAGGTGAAACRFSNLNCGINPRAAPPPPESLDDFGGRGGGELDLEDGLRATTVTSGLRQPTDLDFLPDGRILVAERDGRIRMVEDGKVRTRPFLDVRARVNTFFFRGMVNVTVDPDFPRRPFVYVVYAVRGQDPRVSASPTSVHLSRFEVRGDVAVASSERVLVGAESGRSCTSLRPGADCLPADGTHIGSDIVFARDGTLLVSTGDGTGDGSERAERAGLLAQDVDSLGGKILHINREGRGLRGNPFWNGDADANKSKIWATGLRNPFRMELVPGADDALLVADVGWDAYEELNVVERGLNHGWPCYEGPERTQKFSEFRLCASQYADAPAAVEPWLAIRQVNELAITGGVFVGEASGWPPDLANHYVFGDWATSEIYAIPWSLDRPAEEPRTIARNAGGPVAFELRPEGLYVLSVNTGTLSRIAPG